MIIYNIEEDSNSIRVFAGDELILRFDRAYSLWGTNHSKVFKDNQLILEYTQSSSLFNRRIKILKNLIGEFVIKKKVHYSIVNKGHSISLKRERFSKKSFSIYQDIFEVGYVETPLLEIGLPYTYKLFFYQNDEFEIYYILVFVFNLSTLFDHA